MSLTAEQKAQREGKLTSSRIAILMMGVAADIDRLYREMIGESPEENLDHIWPVQLGAATEKLNLDWYERKNGVILAHRGRVVTHPDWPWAAATLDGWDDKLKCPVECKHVGGYEPMEIIIDRYQPQLQWQMWCTGASKCALSVITGAREPIVDYIDAAPDYQTIMIDRAEHFMMCVDLRNPPVDIAPVTPPAAERIVDMTGNNAWAASAANFLATEEAAKLPKRKGLSGWMARRKEEKNYMKFLAFNEMLPIDKGMRAEFDKKTALSVLWRKRDMIYGLVGGKCKVCGTVQFPRSQVCVNPNCHAIDSQEPYAMAGLEASVMSFTADSLTYSPDPPAYYGMITFPEGGRFMADFTDSDKEQVKVGAKMRMTFRIRDNDTMRGGFKRYFWKAAPV